MSSVTLFQQPGMIYSLFNRMKIMNRRKSLPNEKELDKGEEVLYKYVATETDNKHVVLPSHTVVDSPPSCPYILRMADKKDNMEETPIYDIIDVNENITLLMTATRKLKNNTL